MSIKLDHGDGDLDGVDADLALLERRVPPHQCGCNARVGEHDDGAANEPTQQLATKPSVQRQ